jgi:type IV pilus assembly protein PilA
MNNKSKKGFTLVEIMIVVVIIGLLAAMAIPAFQKVRTESVKKTVVNDGRLIGSAAQQYFMEYGTTEVYAYDIIGEGLYVESLSKGVSIDSGLDPLSDGGDFTLKHPNLDPNTLSFDDAGHLN